MSKKVEAFIEITANDDGTFRIEERGCHYGSASLGDAISWFAERLIDMRSEAAA